MTDGDDATSRTDSQSDLTEAIRAATSCGRDAADGADRGQDRGGRGQDGPRARRRRGRRGARPGGQEAPRGGEAYADAAGRSGPTRERAELGCSRRTCRQQLVRRRAGGPGRRRGRGGRRRRGRPAAMGQVMKVVSRGRRAGPRAAGSPPRSAASWPLTRPERRRRAVGPPAGQAAAGFGDAPRPLGPLPSPSPRVTRRSAAAAAVARVDRHGRAVARRRPGARRGGADRDRPARRCRRGRRRCGVKPACARARERLARSTCR